MKRRSLVSKGRSFASISRAVAPLVMSALLAGPAAAQYERPRSAEPQQLSWENNRLRLSRILVEPGGSLPAGADRVLVYLTAGPDGMMPAEAVWQPARSGDIQNRGRVRLEAIAIELKDVPQAAAGGTPPEALAAAHGADVSLLIDNPRVMVTKHRYAPYAFVGPLHFHAEDMLVVYLRGGYTWPAGGGWGSYRVRRGEMDVIPANTFHTLANAGADPLEFLAIIPR
jgi:quercetin dioxygenase-like cupin family protein